MSIADRICRMAGARKLLDMLQEECAELIQAASKTKRVMDEEETVDPAKTRAGMIEELADVENMILLIKRRLLNEDELTQVETTKFEKMTRYYKRLLKRRNRDARLDG